MVSAPVHLFCCSKPGSGGDGGGGTEDPPAPLKVTSSLVTVHLVCLIPTQILFHTAGLCTVQPVPVSSIDFLKSYVHLQGIKER